MFYDRNPESMRTVPRVCGTGRDSVSLDSSAAVAAAAVSLARPLNYSKNRPEAKKYPKLMFSAYEFAGFGSRNVSGGLDVSTSLT